MAHVPKMASGNISLTRGFHCRPNFVFIYFAQQAALYCEEYVYIYSYLQLKVVFELQLLPIIMQVEPFVKIRERREVWTGYLSLGCRSGGAWANT
jgi:hypothetical protein